MTSSLLNLVDNLAEENIRPVEFSQNIVSDENLNEYLGLKPTNIVQEQLNLKITETY